MNCKYTINQREYDLSDVAIMIKSGKWDAAMTKIRTECRVDSDEARQIGIRIKEKLGAERETTIKEREYRLRNMKVTSGYDFQGYRITEYLGVHTGEAVIGTGMIAEVSASVADILGVESNSIAKKMQTAQEYASKALFDKCTDLDGNAIIGFDYECFTLKANMLCVLAKGTVVKIEKI